MDNTQLPLKSLKNDKVSFLDDSVEISLLNVPQIWLHGLTMNVTNYIGVILKDLSLNPLRFQIRHPKHPNPTCYTS